MQLFFNVQNVRRIQVPSLALLLIRNHSVVFPLIFVTYRFLGEIGCSVSVIRTHFTVSFLHTLPLILSDVLISYEKGRRKEDWFEDWRLIRLLNFCGPRISKRTKVTSIRSWRKSTQKRENCQTVVCFIQRNSWWKCGNLSLCLAQVLNEMPRLVDDRTKDLLGPSPLYSCDSRVVRKLVLSTGFSERGPAWVSTFHPSFSVSLPLPQCLQSEVLNTNPVAQINS